MKRIIEWRKNDEKLIMADKIEDLYAIKNFINSHTNGKCVQNNV